MGREEQTCITVGRVVLGESGLKARGGSSLVHAARFYFSIVFLTKISESYVDTQVFRCWFEPRHHSPANSSRKKKRGLPELSAEHNLFFFPPFLHSFIPGL